MTVSSKRKQTSVGKLPLSSYPLVKHIWKSSAHHLLKTQFQIKGGRSVHRRDIFDVSGKRYKSFLKTLSTRIFLCEEETYKKILRKWFFGFIPFGSLISPTIICFNALKIRLFFVKKTKNTVKNSFYLEI